MNTEILSNDVDDPNFSMKVEKIAWRLNPYAPAFFPPRISTQLSAVNPPIFPPTNQLLLPYPLTLPVFSPRSFPQFSHPYFPLPAVPACSRPREIVASVPSPPPMSTEPVSSLRTVAGKRNTKGTRTRSTQKRYYWRAKPSTVEDNTNANFRLACYKNNRGKHPLIPFKLDGNETTVMIKNIPNRYTRELLKDFLDRHCMSMNKESHRDGASDGEPLISAFDFLYLPIDFQLNKGYAFVNFENPRAARRFFDACHGQPWDLFQSTKIREIYSAKLQGMEQLMQRFKPMGFPLEEFQPLSFNPARDGLNQSVKERPVGRCTSFKF